MENVTRTFVFWDLVGSTRGWERDPSAMAAAVQTMEQTTALHIGRHGGELFKLTGDGGCAAFESARGALTAAIDMQRALLVDDLRVRVGVYSGEAEHRNGDWFGVPLNRCARLMALGHGGQILVAASTAQLLPRTADDARWSLRDLGVHLLRDIDEPVVVYQSVAEGLPDEFPPLATVSRVVALPATRDRLIGRDDDVEEIVAAFAAHRLVTICGIGGAGKTRLAVEVARSLGDDYSSTVFVDLSLAAHDSQVVSTAINSFGLSDAGVEPLELLTSHLQGRSALLVLDNAEHLLDPTCDLVEAILDHCPSAVILVTSREPLGVSGERVFRVRSLDPSTTGVELLRDRVGQPIDGPKAVELCEHLDGIPLAIELAAARIRSLGIDEVLDNIGDRFRLLVGGRRAQGRQATLQATLVWSHELLDGDERAMLRRLSVFSGGFPARAVDAVCGDPSSSTAPRETLAALVDKSMVTLDAGRHRLLETVRLFAQERLLEAGEVDEYRDRHARWVLDEARRLGMLSSTLQQHLIPEINNIRAALDWLEETDRPCQLLETVTWTAAIWYSVPGGDPEFHPRVLSAFERCGDDADHSLALLTYAVLAATAPTSAEAFAWAQRGHALDPTHEVAAARTVGLMHYVALATTDPHAALRGLAELPTLPGGVGSEVELACTMFRSQILFELGDQPAAESVLESILDDRTCIYWRGPVTSLVMLRAVTGDIVGAEAVLAEIEHDIPADLRITDVGLAGVRVHLAVARGDVAAAGSALRKLEAMRDDVRLTATDAVDHVWFNAAADAAAMIGDLGGAAILVSGAMATRHIESHPFVIGTLRQRHGEDPAWQAAVARSPSIVDAIATARRIARII
jgi:predicted ATPase/class 3 adenylate cyclase